MPDINQLRGKYFISSAHTTKDNFVEILIDGNEFFGRVKQDIDILRFQRSGTGRFFYMTAWHLGTSKAPDFPDNEVYDFEKKDSGTWRQHITFAGVPPFELATGVRFIDQLADMKANKIDVRVFPWVSPYITRYQEAAQAAGYIWGVNMHSLVSTVEVRKKLGDRLTEPNLRLTLLTFCLMPSNRSKYLLLCRFLQIGTGSYPEKVLTCQRAYGPILRRSQN